MLNNRIATNIDFINQRYWHTKAIFMIQVMKEDESYHPGIPAWR